MRERLLRILLYLYLSEVIEPTFVQRIVRHLHPTVAMHNHGNEYHTPGNWTMGSYSILFDHVLLKPYSTTALQVRTIDDSNFATLVALNLVAQGAINAVGIGNYGGYVKSETGVYSNLFRPETELENMVFRTGDSAGKVTFQAYDSGTFMLETVGELNDGAFTLFRAGDITFKANKTLKVGNISATGTPATQTKYIPVDDGGTTRYIMLHDSVS